MSIQSCGGHLGQVVDSTLGEDLGLQSPVAQRLHSIQVREHTQFLYISDKSPIFTQGSLYALLAPT